MHNQTQVKKNSKKAATDTILDRIETEIDQQGKCIEDLSRKLRFHLEKVCKDILLGFFPDCIVCSANLSNVFLFQKREEYRSSEVLEELRSIKSEMKAHRTELSELRQDFSRIMQQQSLGE